LTNASTGLNIILRFNIIKMKDKKVGKKDQRGIAHLMLIVIVLVVGGAIGLAAWRVSSAQKDKDGTSNSSVSTGNTAKEDKELAKTCLAAIKDKNLCKFASLSSFDLNSVSYQAVMANTDKDGKKSEITSQVDGKNNTSMISKEDGKEVYAYVLLNGAMYTKNAGETTWTKFPSSTPNATQDSSPSNEVKLDTKDFTGEKNTMSYKALGKEKCGNLTCYKYQIIDTEHPSDETFMWFDTKDYRIQRYRFKAEDGTTDMTFTYKKIKISEPSPVKEFSAQSSADLQAAQAAAAAAAASVGANASSDDE
jgi:outer membrane lipoprotein-sorting protein